MFSRFNLAPPLHLLLASLVSIVCLALNPMAALAQAGTGPWTLQDVSGNVSIATPGEPARPARAGEVLSANAVVSTSADGRAVVARGRDRATMAAGSALAVADTGTGSLFTRVVQRLGTVLFQVEKTPETDFEVQTPYLAATVKGTTFTVTVRSEGAAVHVTDGAVQVATRDNAQRVLLRPGQSGSVSSEPGAGIEVKKQEGRAQPEPSGDSDTAETETAEAEAAQNDPGQNDTGAPAAQEASNAKADGKGKGNGKALGQTIGVEATDFSRLTGGFAGNASASAGRSAGKGKSSVLFVETSSTASPGNSGSAGNGRGNTTGAAVNNGRGNGKAGGSKAAGRLATIGDAVSIGRPTGIDVSVAKANSNASANSNAGGNGNGNGRGASNGNSSSNNAGGNGNNVFVANGSSNGNGNSGNGNGSNNGNSGNGNNGNGNGNNGNNGNGNSGNGNNGNNGNGNGNGKNK
tara:strand:- start:22 stop:1413 length:1392 start_codon:yes stop_codon:yes gene_type:complete